MNQPAPPKLTKDNDLEMIEACGKALDEQEVPSEGRMVYWHGEVIPLEDLGKNMTTEELEYYGGLA